MQPPGATDPATAPDPSTTAPDSSATGPDPSARALAVLPHAVAAATGLAPLIDRIDGAFAAFGVRAGQVVLPPSSADGRRLAARDAAAGVVRAADSVEQSVISAWRVEAAAGRALDPVDAPGGLLVPLVAVGRVLGALRLEATAGSDGRPRPDTEVLLAAGAACAEVLRRAGARREAQQVRRRLTDATGRERAAAAAAHEAGVALARVADSLAGIATEAPANAWRERVISAAHAATDAARSLSHADFAFELLAARSTNPARTLRDMARRFEARTGGAATVRVIGEPRRLRPAVEAAMVQVAHEALVNAVRRGRSSIVSLLLTYGEGEVSLRARDDGAGLAHREPFSSGPGRLGIVGLRVLLAELGGTLDVRDAHPRGLLLEGRLPTGSARNAQPRRRQPGASSGTSTERHVGGAA